MDSAGRNSPNQENQWILEPFQFMDVGFYSGEGRAELFPSDNPTSSVGFSIAGLIGSHQGGSAFSDRHPVGHSIEHMLI